VTAPLPVVFVSHGSPMHALEAGAAGQAWAALARGLPRPRAIVIVSAHWETLAPALTGAARPQTIHDFYGFPEPLYRIRYPAPGAPELAARAAALLAQAGFAAQVDPAHGLDHGAWSPLLHAYPEADVPVVQLSLQTERGTRHHIALGRALAPLAGEGVLLIGSGHMTHNLRDFDRGGGQVAPLAYAREFQAWVAGRIAARDLDALADYRSRAPHALRAHPSEEHFLPLFFALGAAAPTGASERLYDGIEGGALAMDAWLFRPAGA
jgi:4,5-DOPA dioxygenase extradiol